MFDTSQPHEPSVVYLVPIPRARPITLEFFNTVQQTIKEILPAMEPGFPYLVEWLYGPELEHAL